ncbi:MAG: hypothetical protein WBP12_03665 [Candidatus Saccharimonas sp.]
MKRIGLLLRAVFVGGVLWLSSVTTVLNTYAIDTQPTELPKNGTLIITAYKATVTDTTPTATSSNKLYRIDTVDLVQVYNSGSVPINIAEWRILDSFNPTRELLFNRAERHGWLEPGNHVVLAANDSRVTYRLDGWSTASATAVKTPGLSLVHDAYRASQVDVTVSNILRKRVFGSTSYNTTFQDAVVQSDVADETATNVLFEDGLYTPSVLPGLEIVEIYPYASTCSPFDTSVLCGDYVKLYNSTDSVIDLGDLVLRTDSSSSSRTVSNAFTLTGLLEPGEYRTIWQTDAGARLSLTNSGGYVWLEDHYGLLGSAQYIKTVVRYESASSSLQGYSYALSGDGNWAWSSTPMPMSANIVTPPAEVPCPDGKYRNPETNRCRTIEDTLNALTACEEGYERNPLTNRCRKIGGSATASLTPCKEGQVRNPETNRCRSIASEVADLIPCNDGYERNPATNRCRKVVAGSEVKGAEYPVEPIEQGSGNTVGLWTLVGVVAIAVLYGVWEWRHEIARLGQRVWSRMFWWRK